MTPLKRSNNIAARMGRWSASHWKTAVFGWLAFVVAALVIGNMVGTKQIDDADVNVGQSHKADQILDKGFPQADPQTEVVLIKSPNLVAESPEYRAVIGEVVAAVEGNSAVKNIESPLAPGNEAQISKDRNAVMVTVGTGIGGGLILGGQVYRGTNGGGSELGHTVVEFDGPRCQGSCPNRGCVEAVASGTALAREGKLAAEREPDSALGKALAEGRAIDGVLVTEAAKTGDETAVGVFTLIGRKLGAALTSFANIFEPEVIVVGGGVAAGAGEILIGPAREEVVTKALPPMNRVPVVPAELGGESGMIGAAAMARLELGEER